MRTMLHLVEAHTSASRALRTIFIETFRFHSKIIIQFLAMCYPLALLYAPLRHHNIELNLHHKNIKVILFVFIFFFSRLVSFLHFGSITIAVATFFRSIPLAHFWHLCVRFEIACDACSHEKLLSEFAMIANAANLSSHSDCMRLFFIAVPFEFVCVFFVDFLHTHKIRAILFLQIKMHMFG